MTVALIAALRHHVRDLEGHGKLHVPMMDVSALIVAEEVFPRLGLHRHLARSMAIIRHAARWARSLYY